MQKRIIYFFTLMFFLSSGLSAGEINVAVASNFKYTLAKLAADFKEKSGHDLKISSASSGKLFTQIVHGAPYDVFLSADEKRVDLLIDEKRSRERNTYVYALGKLVLLSNFEQPDDCKDVLRSNRLKHLAIANPKIAPYGTAAKQVLNKLGLWQQLKPRLVMGENVAQTLQFVSTGNAQAGFVAKSMLDMAAFQLVKVVATGCVWDIPAEMYSPIKQKMVLLNKADNNPAAHDFMRYMQSRDAKSIIQSTGYDVL